MRNFMIMFPGLEQMGPRCLVNEKGKWLKCQWVSDELDNIYYTIYTILYVWLPGKTSHIN
jgi:hypothetical protein